LRSTKLLFHDGRTAAAATKAVTLRAVPRVKLSTPGCSPAGRAAAHADRPALTPEQVAELGRQIVADLAAGRRACVH
jgi:hypothetical protein